MNNNDYNKKLEQKLLEITKLKEKSDKNLLFSEIIIVILSIIIFVGFMIIGGFLNIEDNTKNILIIFGLICFASSDMYCLRMEQIAGYYKCEKCGYEYIPDFKSIIFSMHVNRTRYMKCKKCNKRGWHKKILVKSHNNF